MTTERASLGDAGLDDVLGGGLPRGRLCLVRGSSGAGKTTLCLQFLLEGVKRGERVLYVGTSETDAELDIIARSHGWSLDGVTLHHPALGFDEEQTVLHPAELELPQTIDSMLSVVAEVAPQRLVIDSLAEIRLLARDELWYRRQLMKLREFFAGHDCTVLLVDLAPAGGSDESALNSVVHGVVQLEPSTPRYGPIQRRLRVIKMRGQDFATGYHDYRVRSGGLEVFPRLIAAEHRKRFPKESVSSGSLELDTALGGGLARGASTLLLGPSGTGKSVIATQMAVSSAQRGERCDMYVFDERVQTLLDRADGIGLPLDRHLETGLLGVHQVDPAELTAGEFSHVVRSAVERDGTRMIVIDSLNGYDYAMPEERTLSVHLHELSSYLSQRAVTPVFTMTQHGLMGERIHDPFEVSYIADTVILFRHFEFDGRIHKALSVYKHRSGAHETTIRRLRIGAGGVVVGETLTGFTGVLSGQPAYTRHSVDKGASPTALEP